jgi:hypothetical protein
MAQTLTLWRVRTVDVHPEYGDAFYVVATDFEAARRVAYEGHAAAYPDAMLVILFIDPVQADMSLLFVQKLGGA